MKSNIYAIYDNKAEAYMQPFFAATPGLALRAFSDNVNNKESIFNKHPNDFVLYEIGEFDDATGDLKKHKENHNLGMAIEYHQNNQIEAVK